MNLTKIIQKQILRDYLFMTGFVDIDSQYFIEKIESQIQGDDNLNGKTNVKGGMTNWSYFAKDEKFWTPFFPIQDYLEENNCLKSNYLINEIWGVCEPKGAYTRIHNHAPALFGGVIYLNSSNQKLFFPDIKQEIKPEQETTAKVVRKLKVTAAQRNTIKKINLKRKIMPKDTERKIKIN